MVMLPTSPSTWRSSGTKPTPASRILRTERPTSSWPSSLIEPVTWSWRPSSASVSSVWPLPCTPATASTSPRLMVKLRSSTWTWPRASMTRRLSTTSASSPSCGGSLRTVSSTGRPTIMAASSWLLAVGEASPTTLPSRITVILSATSRTSRSLWVMKTMAFPASLSWRMVPISSSVSCGVSTAVGSSKTSTSASRESALMISTRCCTPTGRSSMTESGVHVEAELLGDLRDPLARGVEVEGAGEAGGLVAEHDVLGDREDGDEHEVLVHHADAGRDGVAGTGEVLDLVVEQDLALVGPVEAVQHVHQRGLAGAVLAQEAVDLARLDRQRDPVVGDQRPEALGDVTQLQLHGVAS